MARLAHRARPPILGSLCLLGAVVSLGPVPHSHPIEPAPMGPRPPVIVAGIPGAGVPEAWLATIDPHFVIRPPMIDPWMVIVPPAIDPHIAATPLPNGVPAMAKPPKTGAPDLDLLHTGPLGFQPAPLLGVDDVLSGFLRTLAAVAPHPA